MKKKGDKVKISLPNQLAKKDNNKNKIYNLSFLLLISSFLSSLLFFDFSLLAAADDAGYLISGHNFWSSGTWPGDFAPLFCIILGFFVKLIGYKIVVLKILPLLFFLVFIYYFWNFYSKKLDILIALPVILMVIFNPSIITMASTLYAETFFMALSILTIRYFHLYFEEIEPLTNAKVRRDFVFKTDIKRVLGLAFFVLALYLSRTVGLLIAGIIFLFFILHKKFVAALAFTSSMILVVMLFVGTKKLAWDIPVFANSQLSGLRNIDFYDASKGQEKFTGYLVRLRDNSKLYISNHLLRGLGFIQFNSKKQSEKLVYAIFVVSIFLFLAVFKKNKYIAFAGLYGFGMCILSFIILQVYWNQERYIFPFVPFILIFWIGSIYLLLSQYFNKSAPLRVALTIILPFITLMTYSKQVNFIRLQEGLTGNYFYGQPIEWINYYQSFKFVAQNEYKDKLTAVRKPSLAKIYSGGIDFYGISTTNEATDIDKFLLRLKNDKVELYILDQCLGTFGNIYKLVESKYPGTFTIIKQIGEKEKAAYICKINYPSQLK